MADTEFVRLLVIPDVAEIHAKFLETILIAKRMQMAARTLTEMGAPGDAMLVAATDDLFTVEAAHKEFNMNLRNVAVDTAVLAQKGIVEKLRSTQIRSD